MEQGGQVVAYASHTFTKAEKNYSVIQECLAVVYMHATKQYCHFLLGSDDTGYLHKKWKGCYIARWALALQEFDFKIEYKPGSQNGNADVLSHRDSLSTESSPCAATFLQPDPTQNALCVAQ